MDLEALNIAIEYIETHLDQKVLVADVCKHMHYSARQLDRKFTEAFQVTVPKYIQLRRMTVTLLEMAEMKKTIGFTANQFQHDFATFSRSVRRQYGQSPRALLRQGKELNLFPKADVTLLINKIKALEETLSGLQTKGILNYKITANKRDVIINNLNYRWMYSYLRSRPAIPVPLAFIDGLDNSNCLDKLTAIIACSYYELEQNGFDVTKLRWDISYWDAIAQREDQRLEEIYSEVESLYDLENPLQDHKTQLVWYYPSNEFLYKLLGVLGGQDMKQPPISYFVNKIEFFDFAETAYKASLVKFSGRVGSSEIFVDFNAKKLLDIVNKIGSEVTLSEEFVQALADGQAFTKDKDELKINFFIIAHYYKIDNPLQIDDCYTYKFNPFILDILKFLAKMHDKDLGQTFLSYEITQEEDSLVLTLIEPFQMLYLEEKMEK